MTEEFETAVKNLSKMVDTLNISDKKSVNEIIVLKKDLESKTNKLSNHEELKKQFLEVDDQVQKRLRRYKLYDVIIGKYDFSTKANKGNIEWIESVNPVFTCTRHTGTSYWCIRSQEVLEGPFRASVKVKRINQSYTGSMWYYGFGIQKKDSVKLDDYYSDSCCLYSNGQTNVKFQGSNGPIIFPGMLWKEEDILYCQRDENMDVFFGINNETNMVKAFDRIDGEFRLVLGFIHSIENDVFELLDIEKS